MTYSPSGSIELPIIVLPLASGKCGSNLNRRLYDDGRLNITGTGAKITVSAADCIAIRMHILTRTSLGTTGIWLS
ncbi:MAG: hypothetical protein SOV18_04210 [Eubacteriales bacterium]|nr:hypothetical protein [Eubacteriales bacterium]